MHIINDCSYDKAVIRSAMLHIFIHPAFRHHVQILITSFHHVMLNHLRYLHTLFRIFRLFE